MKINIYNIISDLLYGLKAKFSTYNASTDATNYLSSSLDKNDFTMGVFVDVRKTLDL